MARKATAENVAAANGPPRTPEEIFNEHYSPIAAALLAFEKARDEAAVLNGVYRNELKKFKKAGGDSDALTKALALRKLEPDDVSRSFRNLNNYLKWMGLPVGTQLGLFDDGTTVAQHVNDAAIAKAAAAKPDTGPEVLTEKSLYSIEQDGEKAGFDGKDAEVNPYADGSPAFLRFNLGWKRGRDRRDFVAPSRAGIDVPEEVS